MQKLFSRYCGLSLRKHVAVAAIMLLSASQAVQGQANGSGQELFNYPDTLLSGIVSAQSTKTAEECRKLCSTRSGCAGFDHAPKGDVCRLFASVGSARSETAATAETRNLLTGYRDPTNPPLAARLEKLMATDMQGNELFALSKLAFEKGDRNVGWKAINLALQRGNESAKLEIARWYDPRTFSPDRVDAIDANKAARSYFELALEGNPEANSLLGSLCGEAADAGSSHAAAFESFLRTTYCEGSMNP